MKNTNLVFSNLTETDVVYFLPLQQEYKNEGVDVDGAISFVDNKCVLEMFLSKPLGLLALLDEESSLAKASDASLMSKFRTRIFEGENGSRCVFITCLVCAAFRVSAIIQSFQQLLARGQFNP